MIVYIQKYYYLKQDSNTYEITLFDKDNNKVYSSPSRELERNIILKSVTWVAEKHCKHL